MASPHYFVEPTRYSPREVPQNAVEDHRVPTAGPTVEECASGYLYLQSLLETQRLCAELHLIGPMTLRPSQLELYRKWLPQAIEAVEPASSSPSH